MRLSSLVYLCLSITASLAAPEGEPNTGEAVNWSSLRQAMYDYPQLPTKSSH